LIKLNQVTNGFFGGLIGLAFAAPILVHWTWMETVKFRVQNPASRFEFYLSAALLFPLSVLTGLICPLSASAYFAYLCYKDGSLEPIAKIIKAPYEALPSDETTQHEININQGMLIGSSFIVTLMSFTIINILTGNIFGLLGAPGAAIATVFGLGGAGLFTTTLFTLGVSFLGGLFGGLSAGAISWANAPAEQNLPVEQVLPPPVPYTLIDDYDNGPDNFNNPSYTAATFISIPRINTLATQWGQFWNRSERGSQHEMQRLNIPMDGLLDDEEEEDIIYFDTNRPVPEPIPYVDEPSTQSTSPGMRI
jgi:hypothetical protein